jgi:NADH-quinone oxidoreductase subunit C
MDNSGIREYIEKIFPVVDVKESNGLLQIEISPVHLHSAAIALKENPGLLFDYLYCLTGVDLPSQFLVIYHLRSTGLKHELVLKVKTADRNDPSIDTVSDIWPTAEFHEREVYDLLGVKFNNHKDLRRLFLDDDWGFPLRKDYKDDINIIER